MTSKVHFKHESRGRKQLQLGEIEQKPQARVPRVAKLMSLAIRLVRLIREGVVSDQSELAWFSHVTQPHMTQIMALNNLDSDIQEAILHLPRVTEGKDPVHEKKLRPIAAEVDW